MTQLAHVPEGRPPPRDPVLAALERIEGRLARLEAAAQRVDAAALQAPRALAMLADSFDEAAGRLQDRGVDVDARLRALLPLVEKLTDPATLKALEGATEMAARAPQAVAAAVDTIDGVIAGLQARGIDLDDRLCTTLAIAERLTSPPALSAVSALLDHLDDLRFLLDSGVLDKHAVRLVGELGRALAASSAETPPQVGMFGALRALGTPDIQRALGFTLRLAGRFGAALRHAESKPAALAQGDR